MVATLAKKGKKRFVFSIFWYAIIAGAMGGRLLANATFGWLFKHATYNTISGEGGKAALLPKLWPVILPMQTRSRHIKQL